MTREQYDELSAPLVRTLLDMEDDILREIAAQLAKDGKVSDTSKWRIRQLARSGRFDKRAAAIIDGYSGVQNGQAFDMVLEAAKTEIGYLDNAVQAANMAGLADYFSDIPAEASALNAAKAFQMQAASDLNLVNTVMKYKAGSSFVNAVNSVYRESKKNRQDVLDVMGKSAAKTVMGHMSLQEATRKTIRELARKGIPAFTDKLGREWSPEAYIMMDMRSTLANTARAAQDMRCDQYGIKLIEVSSHMGARPLCALYQGRIFSRDGSKGITMDGAGGKIYYTPLSETSFGEPAGLFGINCGHVQYPFAPGINFQRYFPYPEEENAERYKQFQRQRAMERDIRATKRECMMFNETGDKEAFDRASVRLKAQKKKYSDYCKDTGLKQHNDRTQVYGFDRSVSSKAVWAQRKAAPTGLTGGGNSGTINTGKVIANVTCGNPMSIDEALKANPNYSSGREYQINCQRSVQAYELRRRGYPVIAMPKPSSNNLVSWGSECFIPPSADARDSYTFYNKSDEVKKEISSAPDGARYSIYIAWKGRSNSAHVFIAEKQGNTIRYVDPQTGNSDVSSYFLRGKRFGLCRLDDKDILANDTIINQTVEKEK